jgi:putative DNA primase/helicase
MTAPLLKKLNIEPHCTDHHNNTSHGKTLTSMLALSAVGYPKGLMIGAKSTAKGILVSVRDYSDLPFLVDETSDVNDDFSDVIYTLTSGKGRVKSTKDGERDGGELYRTSTMFTGENPIRDYLPKSGQQFRVIELNDVIPNMPTQKIDEIKDVMENNYGHIIIPFIQEICKNDIKKIYKDCFALLPKTVNNIEGRSKSIFACIMVAGILLEKIFKEIGIPERDPVKIVNKYFKECIQDNPIELEWMRALRVINDWAIADHNKFEDGIEELKFNVVGKISFEYIDIIGTEFTKKMKECGFSATAIKKQLFENGISICTSSRKDGNYTVNVNNKPAAGIRIIRKVMAEKLELSKDIPDWCIGYTRKVLETVIFLCKMRGSASLKQIQEIVGFTHRLGYSIIDSLEKLEQTNLIVEKNGEYVSIVL